MKPMSFQNILFYKYVTIEQPQVFADALRLRAQELGFKGRAIVAEEGINATFEGEQEKTDLFVKELKQDPRFSDLKVKTSLGDGKTFLRLSVKVRKEIVGTQFSSQDADPRVRTAIYLPAEQLHQMYESKQDFVVVDMRNSYEFASGHFKNSIDPGMRASRDLEKMIVKLEPYKGKKIVTVCTGGVRCEKMSAYLLNRGFKDVSQLEDGIHGYMQKYPGEDFVGTLYTFDERVMMDFGGERDIVGECHSCKQKTERYVNCANDICHLHMLMCERCAPTQVRSYCGMKCQVQGELLNTMHASKKVIAPWKKELRRMKKQAIRKSMRVIWKVKRLKKSLIQKEVA